MKVLLIGGGGREHALGWKIAQSPILSKLYLAPGNPGLNELGEAIDVDPNNNAEISQFAKENGIDLVVVGPEAPLTTGIADALKAGGIACFGPEKEAAKLEGSKSFMKEICAAANAPTARYETFSDPIAAKAFLQDLTAPFVIKADGLAAGKGVIIAETQPEAEQAIDEMLSGKFGDASKTIIIEEFLEGEEVSFFALVDGKNILPLLAAQDHKRAYDGDKGPNTGGMGAYSPVKIFTEHTKQQTIDTIIRPIVEEMQKRGTPYRGVIFAGLMISETGPRLIEINTRFGDPECQVLMRLLQDDLLPTLNDAARGKLTQKTLCWSDKACALVVLASEGYPGAYPKGSAINGIDRAETLDGVVCFHAGTKLQDDLLVSNGGRVLNVTATADTMKNAVTTAYEAVDHIDWKDGFCRRDIAWRAL